MELLGFTVDELRAGLEDIRDLVHGILPPALVTGGLPAAIADLARPDTVVVTCQVPGRYAPSIEATAWFVACEGIATPASTLPARPSTSRCPPPVAGCWSGSATTGRAAPTPTAGDCGTSPTGCRHTAAPCASTAPPAAVPLSSRTCVRVVVADDAVLLREGSCASSPDDGYHVVAAVGSAPDLVRAAHSLTPDLVIADIRMPPGHTDDGIVAARGIRAHRPQTAVVLAVAVCRGHRCRRPLPGQPGRHGLLPRTGYCRSTTSSTRCAGSPAAAAPSTLWWWPSSSGAAPPAPIRSPRSPNVVRVLALMAEGLSNSGIAARLHVGVRTVETYTARCSPSSASPAPRGAPSGQGRPGVPGQRPP